jgi:hypothetical protein
MSIVFNWEDVVVKGKLATLIEKMPDWAEEVLIERAEYARDLAQVLVRVLTGSCRDSIRVERGGKGAHWRQIRFRAGGYIVNPMTGRLVDYAGYLENLYPFMRPAFMAIRPDLAELIKNHVVARATEL